MARPRRYTGRPKREVYKQTLLPTTVNGCRHLLRKLLDELEVARQATLSGTQAGTVLEAEPMLRVPKVGHGG